MTKTTILYPRWPLYATALAFSLPARRTRPCGGIGHALGGAASVNPGIH